MCLCYKVPIYTIHIQYTGCIENVVSAMYDQFCKKIHF